jgi:hypothetical protein
VTGRQTINLDPDVVRASEPGNPPLQGNYTLWVGPQPTDITLLGLLSHRVNSRLYPDVMLPAISMGSIGSAADRSYAWVVYPDGRTKSAGRLLEQTSH